MKGVGQYFEILLWLNFIYHIKMIATLQIQKEKKKENIFLKEKIIIFC